MQINLSSPRCRDEAWDKLRVRALSLLVLTGCIILTVVTASLWWLVLWVPALIFFWCREVLKFLVVKFFQCDFCRKIKTRKHLASEEYPIKLEDGPVVYCDECNRRRMETTRGLRAIQTSLAQLSEDVTFLDLKKRQRRTFTPPVVDPPKIKIDCLVRR